MLEESLQFISLRPHTNCHVCQHAQLKILWLQCLKHPGWERCVVVSYRKTCECGPTPHLQWQHLAQEVAVTPGLPTFDLQHCKLLTEMPVGPNPPAATGLSHDQRAALSACLCVFYFRVRRGRAELNEDSRRRVSLSHAAKLRLRARVNSL